MATQKTFVMIKPEGVQRRLVAQIIDRFERKGLKIIDIRSMTPSKDLVKEHYAHLSHKPFFNDMVDQLSADLVICMIWEGIDAIEVCRRIIGATNPIEAAMGSIRADLAADICANIIHGSDNEENANKEISLWFK
ncbi:nucleoside diphosphate kinase (NME3) [Vairimorpha necatrix]|uniref:Nucleoside diphosphate kinase n=1 Tax=Vairimorpha necatrix TaxID=6039 RepID=A0AAX4JBW0_9MICR